MARIRTIKPDFFTSPSTAKVDFPVRVFYTALWCWADDFGVGETNLNGLLGHAFPDSDGFTAQDVRRFCADCAQHFDVTFYTVRGRHYFAIPSWEKHQKLERREERRKHPSPDDPEAMPDLRFKPRADSAPDSGAESGGIVLEGEREREEEREAELNKPPYPPTLEPTGSVVPMRKTGAEIARARFASVAVVGSVGARQIAHAYNESLNAPLTAKLIGEISSVIDECLRAGINPDAIAAGMDEWTRSDSWAPSQIPKFVHKAANRSRPTNGIGKPSEAALSYADAAEQLLAKVTTR